MMNELQKFIEEMDISDKNIVVFSAFKIALNNTNESIMEILNDPESKKEILLKYEIANKIKDVLNLDNSTELQSILEKSLGVEHNYKEAA
jgi:hypothetical protein